VLIVGVGTLENPCIHNVPVSLLHVPSVSPISRHTGSPTVVLTRLPTQLPNHLFSAEPSQYPSYQLSNLLSFEASSQPSSSPPNVPLRAPATKPRNPISQPMFSGPEYPSLSPTCTPSQISSSLPSEWPSSWPSSLPSVSNFPVRTPPFEPQYPIFSPKDGNFVSPFYKSPSLAPSIQPSFRYHPSTNNHVPSSQQFTSLPTPKPTFPPSHNLSNSWTSSPSATLPLYKKKNKSTQNWEFTPVIRRSVP